MDEHDETACEAAREAIEDDARGEIAREARGRLATHLAGCAPCREIASDARAVRALLRELPRPLCPDPLAARILSAAGELPARGRAPSVRARLARALAGRLPRPAAVAATLAAIVALALFWPRGPATVPAPGTARDVSFLPAGIELPAGIDAADAERAAHQARLAFAIVSAAMNRTARVVETEIQRGIASPLWRGLDEGIEAIPPPFQKSPREGASSIPNGIARRRA